MENEKMAALIQSDRAEFAELVPILWKKTQKVLFKMAREFYNKHRTSCTQRGVELCDIEGSCYSVFTAALDAYKLDKPTLFTSYFNYQFQNMTAELLNIRTERGRQEPLNRADSLDRQIEQGDGSTTTLLDLVADKETCSFEMDVLEAMDRDQEAKAVREAVAALSETERLVIEWYYFENRELKEIGAELNVSVERVRQIRNKAIRELRKNRRLRIIYFGYQQHLGDLYFSRFRNSPQYYELSRKLREREVSYGVMQAELMAAQKKWDAEDYAARQADGSDDPVFTDQLAGILANYLTRQ